MRRRAGGIALVLVAGFGPFAAADSASAAPHHLEGPASTVPRAQRVAAAPLTLSTAFAAPTVSAPGPIGYTLVATNNGTEPLTGVSIIDEVVGSSALTCLPEMPAALASGESLTCSAMREITQTDLDFGLVIHVASASAERPGGDPLDDTDDLTAVTDALVDVLHRPRLTVTSTAVSGRFRKGARVPLRLTVRNSGNVTLTRLAFGSNLRSPRCSSGDARTMAPRASLVCRATYKVTASDARKGRAAIAVVARAERPFGRTDTTSDDVLAKTTVKATVVKKK